MTNQTLSDESSEASEFLKTWDIGNLGSGNDGTQPSPDAKIVIHVPRPLVNIQRAIVVKCRNGKEIGVIPAAYDFANVPARYHEQVLAIVNAGIEITVRDK
jgi:hypothetical protein